MKIIYVSSPAGTGKDTFCDFCKEFLKCETVSTVDFIKGLARAHFGWDGVKDTAGRKLLAGLRSLSGEYNNLPIKMMGSAIKRHGHYCDVLFIMVREYEEMQKMVELYGGNTLQVFRSDVDLCKTEIDFVKGFPPNFFFKWSIDNNGTVGELHDQAMLFCDSITKEVLS